MSSVAVYSSMPADLNSFWMLAGQQFHAGQHACPFANSAVRM
jgi:hypothetical protein